MIPLKDKNYDMVDLCKFIACICIVCIHTAAFSDFVSGGGYYYISSCIFRIAVPFFFVTSGFFYGKKLIHGTAEERKKLLFRYIKRLGIPLIFWEVINIAIEILKQLFIKKLSVGVVVRNVAQSIVFYPYGALWYVQALLIAVIIITYAYERGWLKKCLLISVGLYLVGLLGNTYYFLVAGTGLQGLVDRYLNIFVSTRNVVFVALYFVSAGVWIAEHIEKNGNFKVKRWHTVVLYCIFVLETIAVKNCSSADDKSMFIAFIVLIPALFVTAEESNLKVKNARLLRSYSTGIYFMHKAAIHIWLLVFALIDFEMGATTEFALVFTSCFIACSVGYRINNKKINMLIK